MKFASPLQARSLILFVTAATPAGTMGCLSRTECTYLPTYIPALPTSSTASGSNWGAGPASVTASKSFPTERPLQSDTYRWLYGCSHTSSCENASSSTCRTLSTDSPLGETQFSTKGTTKGHVCVAFWMSINCLDIRRKHASAAGFRRPGTYHNLSGSARGTATNALDVA